MVGAGVVGKCKKEEFPCVGQVGLIEIIACCLCERRAVVVVLKCVAGGGFAKWTGVGEFAKSFGCGPCIEPSFQDAYGNAWFACACYDTEVLQSLLCGGREVFCRKETFPTV